MRKPHPPREKKWWERTVIGNLHLHLRCYDLFVCFCWEILMFFFASSCHDWLVRDFSEHGSFLSRGDDKQKQDIWEWTFPKTVGASVRILQTIGSTMGG